MAKLQKNKEIQDQIQKENRRRMLHKQITKTKKQKHTKTNKKWEVEIIPIAAFKELESKTVMLIFVIL